MASSLAVRDHKTFMVLLHRYRSTGVVAQTLFCLQINVRQTVCFAFSVLPVQNAIVCSLIPTVVQRPLPSVVDVEPSPLAHKLRLYT